MRITGILWRKRHFIQMDEPLGNDIIIVSVRIEAVLLLVSIVSLHAGGESVSQAVVSSSGTSDLQEKVTRGREALAALLSEADPAPEERALMVEAWRTEELRLERLLRESRAAATPVPSATALDSAAKASIPDTEPTAEEDPVQANIREIEKGIRDFQNSLESLNLTPEQRAVQVEEFHRLNAEVLAELKALRHQAAGQRYAAVEGGDTAASSPRMEVPASDRASYLKTELSRVMRDLSQVDPEARAQYIEAHRTTLDEMSEELSKLTLTPAAADSRTHPESSSGSQSETNQ